MRIKKLFPGYPGYSVNIVPFLITIISIYLLASVFEAKAAVVTHSGTIGAHTTWLSVDVHRVTGTVTVSPGIILTIEPGTVVKFNSGTSLDINGALYAVGNESQKIVFTSYRDDSIGDDTNGDGFSAGQPGDWGRVSFSDLVTDSETRLEHAVIRYGGSGNQSSVYIYSADIPLKFSDISYGSSYGIYTYNASPLIEGNTITNNGSYGIYHLYGSPVDRNNTITGNGHGIYVQYATPAIEGNTITGSSNWGIYYVDARNTPVITGNTITGNLRSMIIPASSMPNTTDGNVLAPNSINGVWIRGNARSTDLRFEVLYPGQPHEVNTYQIYDTLTMAAGSTLTVDPGVVVKFNAGAGLDIDGALSAVGTAAQPVVFTSYKDDAYGGDLNLDGYATSPANGDWRGIYFSNLATDASCIIDHGVIRYGGSSNSANIYSYQTDFAIRNSVISNSSTNGIRTYQASLTLLNNEVFGNSADGLRFEYTGSQTVTGNRIFANFGDGIEVLSSVNATVTGSELFGNLGFGLRSSSSQTITATGNWWGAVNGPGGSGPGSGDEVSASVTTTGFLIDGSRFSYFNAGPNLSEGTITAPSVISGMDTSEWGTSSGTRMLYDLEQVVLDYPSVAADSRFELFITYYNPDNTSGIGGNIQGLTDGDGLKIHGSLAIPSVTPIQHYYRLPATSHDTGGLRLNFILENGYRAVVSEVWVVERADTADIAAPASVITSPGAGVHLAGGMVEVRGTATDGAGSGVLGVEVGVDGGSGISWRPVTQLSSDGGWSYRWDLPADGIYGLYVRATDRAGNLEAAGAVVSVVVNQTAPVAVTGLSAFDTPMDSGGSINILWALSADDGAGANDISSYKIERREGSTGSFSVVGTVSAGVVSFTDTTAVNGIQYYYRIVAVDLAGNQTASAVYGPVISIDNNVLDVTPPENVTGLSGTPGNGFVYLAWTRSSDTAQDLVDQLLDISVDGGITWGVAGPDYTDGGVFTLGKEASFRLVEGLVNLTDYRFRIRVKDSSNNISTGTLTGVITPSATAVTTVSGTIASNTTWAAGVFYVSADLTINAGVTLTIKPGVIVKFASGRMMTVNGTLTAVGTSGSPVVFTAFTDDSYGGDSNGGGLSSGTPGYWGRIYFVNTSSSRLEHVVVRYGGSGSQGSVNLYQSNVPVISSNISNGSSFGIYTYNASPLIEGNTISNNDSYGIYHLYGSPVDRNNTITGNSNGIYVQYATPTIDGNTITGNTNYGIYYYDARDAAEITNNIITGNNIPVRLTFSSLPGASAGNTLSPNTKNQIEFWGNTLSRSLVLPSAPVSIYYQVGGTATVATGVKLTIAPGVTWKLGNNSMLDINGALYAVGSASEKIVFTSYRDDSIGGDTNGDGFSNGLPGDWGRISFSDSVIDFLTRLEYAVVHYGGSNNQGSVYMSQANVPVISSDISYGSSYGIYTYNVSPLIEGNTITNNGSHGIYHYYGNPVDRNNTITGNGHGIYVQYATPAIEGNTITGSSNWGIYYVDARNTPVITGNTITGNLRSMIIPAGSMPNTTDGNVLAPNSINGVWIRGNARSADLRFEVLYPGQPHEVNTYQIYDTLTMAAGSTLTVDPGVVMKFYTGAGLDIDGALSAVGTTALPVVFTSYKDDAYGGDLNLDGYATSPANGDWRGISFSNLATDASCIIDHGVIRYGGTNGSGNIYSYLTNFTIRNSIISNSGTNGIRSYQANLTLSNNEIFGNSVDGLRFESTGSETVTGNRIFANFGDGIEVLNSVSTTVTGSEIFGNLGYGLLSSSSQTITATGNWWGAVNGPGGSKPGSGDEVSASVTTTGFLTDGTEFSFFDAGGTNHYGYGIDQPIVSGIPSTEWGVSAPNSFLYNINEKLITAEYAGLSTISPYKVLVTYLNQENGGGVQNLTDMSGELIHPSLTLPTTNPIQYTFPLSRTSVVDGNLKLNFNGISGLRTVVSMIFLMKEASTDNIPPVVHLTSPVNGETLATGEIFISGTAADSGAGVGMVEIGIQKSGGALQWYPVTSINSSGEWNYRWDSPASGEYTVRARASDLNGNRVIAPETALVTIDGLAPSTVTGLVGQGLSGVMGAIRITWVLSTDDGAGSDDVTRYEVYRSGDRSLPYTLVGQLVSGTSRFDDVTVTAGVGYFYYVRTIDLAGNYSDPAVIGPVQSTGAIDATAPQNVTNLTAAATNVSGANPSVYLTWTGSADTEGDLVDQRLYISKNGITFGNNNPGYNNGLPYSLGRGARHHQETGLTVGLAYTFKITTIDEVPNESAGAIVTVTPSGAAGEKVTLSGTISENTSLQAGVYYISSSVTIPVGVTLTFGPGAIVKFGQGTGMTVNGTLTAVGTAGSPVVFTAYTDDSYGGDSNGNGLSSGTQGYWGRIYFENTSSSRLDHTVVRYGGSGSQGNIYLYQSNVPVISSNISNGSSYGIYTYNASPLIEGNTITNNGNTGIYHLYGSNPVDRNNTITGNSYGIYVQYATPTIDGNTITGNTNYGIYYYNASNAPVITNNIITGNMIPLLIPASSLPDNTNVLTPNTRNYIGIRGNNIQTDKQLRVWDKGTPNEINTYVLYDADLTVPVYTFLTIDPGVIVKFASNAGIVVDGALAANGTTAEKIVFTSFKDDSYGGDTNNDVSNSIPLNGDWRGITFNDSFFESSSRVNNVRIRYAGSNGSGALYFYQANVLVENNEISNSSTNGIRIYSASPTIIGNTIWGNSADGVRVEQYANPAITFNSISTNLSDGIEVLSSSNPTATNNQIFMNRGYGLLNRTGNVIDATQSWWGDPDASGPYHPTTNLSGKGDRVSNNVAYSPFRTTVGTEFSYRNFSLEAGTTGGSMTPPVLVQGTLSDVWDQISKRPDRTMVWDSNLVILDYTGLDSARRYKIRVSYFYGDPGEVSIQSMTDGMGNPTHGSMIMPTSAPVQYEFSIPSSYYAGGNLTLKFVHDNPATSLRAAVTEAWVMEDILELSPPRFESVEYNDIDGSRSLNAGDELFFRFSEEMDTSLLVDGTTDANVRLVSAGGHVYGTINQSRWSADSKTIIVTLTAGFTVTGTELITPTGLQDLFGNPSIGTQNLNTTDTIAPQFNGLDWVDQDTSGSLSPGDRYLFHFNETMKTSVIQDGTQNANVYLRPSGGFRYGDVNTVSWSPDGRDLTVTVTEGFTIHGDELVAPAVFVTDVAGNTVTGSHFLTGKDNIQPELMSIRFDDADGSGSVTAGDRYFFMFNEPMKSSALSDNTVEANVNLPPAGRKYGDVNRIAWNNDFTEASVEITQGFTIAGNEVVDPTDLVTDKSGNPVSNTGNLNKVDVIAPQVVKVKAFYISPVSATNNYRLTIQFNSSMDITAEPLAQLTSTGSINPVIPAGGTWLTTLYPNDTYSTPDIVLSQGMDGTIRLSVSGARDWAGNTMLPGADIFQFVLDATPPANPDVSVTSIACSSATLSWVGYTAPGDLTGFHLYRSTAGSFTTVTGLSFTDLIGPAVRNFVVSQLNPGTAYHVALVAMDTVGNFIPTVVSHPITINRPVPPAVPIAVAAGNEPDQAVISWTGYDRSALCGFSGFRVYMAEADFTTVTGLTPIATLNSAESQYTVSGLDRTRTYYFAVVGFNSANEFNDAVTTAAWSDPYAGDITSDMTIGGGAQKEVMISQTMVIKNNATVTIAPGTTLYFASGSGIVVEAGKLVADGTALKPIVLTSENDKTGGTPNPGDWNGVTLSSGDTGSVLRHVFIKYGRGLHLDGSAPVVDAFTALNNSGAGLLLSNSGFLNTSDALLRYNDIGVMTETGAELTITNSVIKNNVTNASSDNSRIINADGNWWGSTDPATIGSKISGSIAFTPFLTYEPVLTPAIAAASGETRVGSRDVALVLASRNAEEMRLSEDSTFTGVFFDVFSPNTIFTLSETGGDKTIFAQFKSPTGTISVPVSILVTYVTEGPVINTFSLADGQVIGRPLTVTAGASAVLGVDVIQFYVDNVLVSGTAGTTLSHLWDVRTLTDGVHRVKLLVRDLAAHVTTIERNVTIGLVPPPAPVITAPTNGLIVTSGPVTIRGTAEPFIPVTVRRNGFVTGTPVAGSNGSFEVANVAIQEGASEFVASASDSTGVSANSNVVTVVLDSGAPAAPVLLTATALPPYGIDLTLKFADTGEHPSKFRVYRRASAFTDAAQATLIANNVTTMLYRDRTVSDGTWFYGLVGMDDAGNASPLSNILSVNYDSTPPAFAISYGKVPPAGVGPLDITLTSSEKLGAAPGLTIRPYVAASPVSVGLTRVDDFTYTGIFDVTGSTPSGTATISASGRDLADNTFSGTPSGVPLVIDTKGPGGVISTNPGEPVQVTANINVSVSLTLNESARVNTIPQLTFTPPAGSPVNVAMIGSGASWSGTLPLNPAMGSGFGQFALSAEDSLGNVGTTITSGTSLEIYNTATPEPTVAPGNPAAVSWPGGEVRLSWGAVDRAESYRVYRGSVPCDTVPTEMVALNLTGTSYTDLPLADGTYCYGVTTDRRGAESAMSSLVEALSDRLAPDVPDGVAVNLGAAGVRITWGSPLSGELPAKYFVYRNGLRIRTVTAGGAGSFEVTDYPSAGGSYSYVVASADSVGNENPASAVIFNLIVGAVSNLQAFINNNTSPLLTWTSSDPSVAGYNVYRGNIKLNNTLLTSPSFTDVFYAGSSRVEYAVRAVNAGGEESPPRKIEVYPIVISAKANQDVNGNPRPLVTGYFSKFEVSVQNREAVNSFLMNHLGLHMTVSGTETYALDQDINQIIAADTTYVSNIIIPIGSSTSSHILRITTTQTGEGGSQVVYQRDVVFSDVQNPSSMVTMTVAQVPLAGGYSMVNVCVRNSGYTDMDIVVNRANGSEPGDIYVAIKNSEGLEISRGTYKGYPPGTRISSGTGFVTIPAGGSLCVDVQILVPANLEEGAVITFTGVVDKFSYQFTGVALNGSIKLSGTMQSGITLSEYYGTAQADKNGYANNEVIQISGQAIDRLTGLPRPNTPLKIGFYLRGFQWFVNVTTDGGGNYIYPYSPTPGLSGEFIIWAAHPDVYDTIDQDRFSLYRVYVSPAQASIRSSKVDTFNFQVTLYNPGDTPLAGFTSLFRAYTVDSFGNEVEEPTIQGQAIFPSGYQVLPGEKKKVDLQLSADIAAPSAANVEYTLASAEGASVIFYGSVTLAPAVPVIAVSSPAAGYVQVSAARGTVRTIPVTVRNNGLRELLDAEMSIPQTVTWISTNLPRSAAGKVLLGNIGVGESRTFDVVITPPSDTVFGDHSDKFVITGSNSTQQTNINVYVLISSQLKGSALFKIYNNLGQLVEGATVRIFNNVIHEQIVSPDTDANGEVQLEGLNPGDWSYQVTAPGHSSINGVVTVIADQIILEEAELNRNLITVTFNVVPVPFTDKYELKIEQRFETHVPVPVLVVDPPYVQLANVTPGFETTIIVKVSNFGLKGLDNVILETADTGTARLEPLITFMPRLGAMETVEVPYHILYRGTGNTLPPGAIGDCAGGLIPGIDFGGLTDAVEGIGAIVRGSTNSYISQQEREALGRLAVGLLVGLHAANFAQGAAGVGKPVEFLASSAAQFAGCLLGSVISSNTGQAGTPPPPYPSQPNYLTGNGGQGCFAAGTPILMADGGVQKIESVKVGDQVMTFDGNAGIVSKVYVRESDHILEIRYHQQNGEGASFLSRLETTDEHLFWVKGYDKWVAGRLLEKGDVLTLPDGDDAEIIEIIRTEQPAIVYNFDVDEYESYFANGVLAHQKCGGEGETGIQQRVRDFMSSDREGR